MTTPRRLADLNPHLLCVLCGGYFIDATTISECGHSFCRSCIFKHLESSKFCPICDVQLNRIKPVYSTRDDKALQRLVYKMVPGLYERELQRRREFYEQPQILQSASCETDYRQDIGRIENSFYSPEENFGVSLEYYDRPKAEGGKPVVHEGDVGEVQRRYLKCPAGVTVGHLKKFIRMKYGLRAKHCVDIFYNNRVVPESFTLIDVADTFNWDKSESMRFGFQILELHPVNVTNPDPDMLAEVVYGDEATQETPSSSFVVESEDKRKNMNRLNIGNKKRKRSTSSKEANDREYQAKKPYIDLLRVDRRPSKIRNNSVENTLIQSKRNNFSKSSMCGLDGNIETSAYSPKEEKDCDPISPEDMDDCVPEEDGVDTKSDEMSQTVESIEEEIMGLVGDGSKDIEEVLARDDPTPGFSMQDQQDMDVNEDLEEDDDEGRLRICDPEEIAEEKGNEENIEQQTSPEPAQTRVLEEKLGDYIEEEVEVVRKESKSRRKNKKAKHHHRHKRDYSPAPEATIVSDDNNDIMKLKVKINRGESESTLARQKSKQEDHLKCSIINDGHTSPRQLKHRSYISTDDADNNSLQSPSNSNIDEDSRNSQSTDDHDARSVASSKEGMDDISCHRNKDGSPHNGVLSREEGVSVVKTQELKDKLLQMRQVRRKNLQKILNTNKHSTDIMGKNINSEDKSTTKSPILLTSPTSSLIVSKVTAQEKMMMMTSNNLENKTPSLEIIMVNKPNSVSKVNEIKNHEIKQKTLTSGVPIVKLTKTNFPPSMLTKHGSISLSTLKNNSETSSKNSEKMNGPKIGEKKRESFGVLDLSGKSTRSCGSSPASEGSNSPSHSQTPQTLINRHLASVESSRRSSSNSPPISSPVAKGSPTRMIQHHPSSLWNLMTLTDTAVQMRNLNVNKSTKTPLQKNSLTSPSPAKSPSRGSPTQLKIPTPNLSLGVKLNRPKPPTSAASFMSNGVPVGVHKPLLSMTQPPRANSSFSGIFPNQSSAIAKKQAGINGRSIRSPPPGIPISKLYEMSKKYDIEMITRGLSSKNKASAGISSS